MGKYIKLFDKHSEYSTYINGNDKLLPNVSYCEDNDEVHFNPWVGGIVKYNVTSTSNPTQLFNGTSGIVELEIDGVPQETIVSSYTFDTTGEHVIKFIQNQTWTSLIGFSSCGQLIYIKMPSTITELNMSTFENCYSLRTIIMPSTITSLGQKVFKGCSNIISVGGVGSGATVEIPNNVTRIRQYAFQLCSGLTNVVIPDNITRIDTLAFNACYALTSVTIGKNVSFIDGDSTTSNVEGGAPFSMTTALESIVVDSANTVYDSRDNCNAIIKTSDSGLIRGCKNTVIPNTVTKIYSNAFSYSGITGNLVLTNNVTYIGSDAFEGCSGLTSITMPNVVKIGSGAFYNCTGLTSVTMPSTITEINNNAFNGCTGLTSITIEATTPPTLKNINAFNNTNNCPICVPAASVDTYKAATKWSDISNRIQAIS